jgi:hypothetical protein
MARNLRSGPVRSADIYPPGRRYAAIEPKRDWFPPVLLLALLIAWVCRIRSRDDDDDQW